MRTMNKPMKPEQITIEYKSTESLLPLLKMEQVERLKIEGVIPPETVREVLEFLSALPELASLSISVRQGDRVSGSIRFPARLRDLDIWGWAPAPDQLAGLESLSVLKIHMTHVEGGIEAFCRLPGLEALYVINSTFEVLKIRGGRPSNLKRLILNSGNLVAFDIMIPNLFPNLEYLRIGSRKPTLIRIAEGAMPQLKALHLEQKVWHPDSEGLETLGPLKSISIAMGMLETVPAFLAHQHEVRDLHLYINAIETLPDFIHAWSKLEFLDLHDNRFRRFPRAVLSLPALKRAGFEGNLFVDEKGFNVGPKMNLLMKEGGRDLLPAKNLEGFLALYWGNLKAAQSMCSIPFLWEMLNHPLEIVRRYAMVVWTQKAPLWQAEKDKLIWLVGEFPLLDQILQTGETAFQEKQPELQSRRLLPGEPKPSEGVLVLGEQHGLSASWLKDFAGTILSEGQLREKMNDTWMDQHDPETQAKLRKNLERLTASQNEANLNLALDLLSGIRIPALSLDWLRALLVNERYETIWKKGLEAAKVALPIEDLAFAWNELRLREDEWEDEFWLLAYNTIEDPKWAKAFSGYRDEYDLKITEGLLNYGLLTAEFLKNKVSGKTLKLEDLTFWGKRASLPVPAGVEMIGFRDCEFRDGALIIDHASGISMLSFSTMQEFSLPDWTRQLTNLKILAFQDVLLDEIPEWLPESFPLLERLVIQDAVDLHQLPASLGDLEKLEALILRGSGVKALPDRITQLSNLHLLDLSECPLMELPDMEGLEKLETFYLNLKTLQHFPGGAKKLSGLKELGLYESRQGSVFPTEIEAGYLRFFPDLEQLELNGDAGQNAILAEDEAPPGLEYIKLVRWGSPGLPDWLFWVRAMKKLELFSPSDLSGAWDKLTALKELNIIVFKPLSIPDSWKTIFPPNLERLRFQGNPVFLPSNLPEILPHLRSLKELAIPPMYRQYQELKARMPRAFGQQR